MKKKKTRVPQKKKIGKAEERFEVRIKYVEHPAYEKMLREAPAGYLG